VLHRLLDLVQAKVVEVREHIAGQVAFAAQLRATAEALAERPVDGPCDESCGCGDRVEATAPVACSLGAADVQARVDEWQALLGGVADRVPIPSGVRLVFAEPAPLGEIGRLAAAERECCPFFAFAITVDDRGVGLEVTAPADGQDLLETVFGPVAATPAGRP